MSEGPILFSSWIPSNFYLVDIELPNPLKPHKIDVFKSTEHYFHCAKVGCCDFFQPCFVDGEPMDPYEIYRAIRDADHPKEAKHLGRLVPLDEDEIRYWDHYGALLAMLEANLAKFQQDTKCRLWLHSTGDRPLVEHRKDPIWGDNMDGTGKNQLGKILELVRARIS